MTHKVVVIPAELSLRTAWEIMERRRIRHLPVVQGRTLLGILSDRDVLTRASVDASGDVVVPDQSAGEAMTPAPYVCEPSTSISEIVRTMTDRKIDALPVMDRDDTLVGLVTTTDLLMLLLEQDEARPLPFVWELELERHGSDRPS